MSRKEAKAQKKMAKKYSTSTTDSYDESVRVISDAEAHRDAVYELPSKLTQIKECFMIQMKRYTRQKIMWVAAVLLLLIPILFFVFQNVDALKGNLPDSHITNLYINTLLMFMPVIVPLLSCMACGSMLSQEFNERTVYLSLPLPMNRSIFYMGKFLAGLVLIEGVVLAAYGLSMILAMTATDTTYTLEIAKSLIVSMAYAFFCCALTYSLSTKIRRGSTMLPFIILFVVLPLIGLVTALLSDNDTLVTVMSYLPVFAPESALLSLGNTTPLSVLGIGKMMFIGFTFNPGSSVALMMIIPIVTGLVFLALGKRAVKGRDM